MEPDEQNKLMGKNRNRGVGTWNRLTAVRRQGAWGKEGEGSPKAHIFMAHGHRQQWGDGQREREKTGPVIVSAIEIKRK